MPITAAASADQPYLARARRVEPPERARLIDSRRPPRGELESPSLSSDSLSLNPLALVSHARQTSVTASSTWRFTVQTTQQKTIDCSLYSLRVLAILCRSPNFFQYSAISLSTTQYGENVAISSWDIPLSLAFSEQSVSTIPTMLLCFFLACQILPHYYALPRPWFSGTP